MRWTDIGSDILDFWREFRQVKYGIASLALLGLFVLTIIFESSLIPFPKAGSRWRDITYWEDNPRSAPPVWINWFSSKRRAKSQILHEQTRAEKQAGTVRILKTEFSYSYSDDIPPIDILIHGMAYGSPIVVLTMERPDGEKIRLLKKSISNADGQKIRVSVDKDARPAVSRFVSEHARQNNRQAQDMLQPIAIIFSEARDNMILTPSPLHGTYIITAEILLPQENDRVENLYITLSGSVSGWLGTDNSKRDIGSGVIAGIKWALLIGLLTAVVAVSLGVVYGVTSAYFGGWVDSLMQRIFEVFVSIPLLPLLIVMSAIFKPSIWTLIVMMSAFFWVGPVKTVRSMGLQIKEETYIEASRAFGASSLRIIFKHMIPLLVPYAFASMALYVPGAIVYESTISLLGLGDSTIVTWGQILHDALSSGAVLNGQWWWVIPPGLAIALMGMSFAFLGFAMDTILHPKLRTR